MKRLVSAFLAGAMALSLAACGGAASTSTAASASASASGSAAVPRLQAATWITSRARASWSLATLFTSP